MCNYINEFIIQLLLEKNIIQQFFRKEMISGVFAMYKFIIRDHGVCNGYEISGIHQ